MHNPRNYSHQRRFNYQYVRAIATQVIAVLVVGFLNLGINNFIGYTPFLLPDGLIDERNFYYLIPVGSLFGGIIAQGAGSRLTLLVSIFLSTIAWLLIYYAKNIRMLQAALMITGLTIGIIKAPSFTYISEVSGPRLRSVFMLFVVLFNVLGIALPSLLLLILPVIGFVLLVILPESPYWLAYKNRTIAAEQAHSKYQGWVKRFTDDVECYASRTTIIANFNHRGRQYLQKSNLIPLATMSWMFLVKNLCGPYILSSFVDLFIRSFVHSSLIAPIEYENLSTTIVSLQFAGVITCLVLISVSGKKKLMYLSLFGEFLLLLFIAIFIFASDPRDYSKSTYYSIISISVFMSITLSHCGLNAVLIILNSELSPVQFRLLNAGVGYAINDALQIIFTQLVAPLIFDSVSLGPIFLVLAIISIVGGLSVKFILPETEGKDLQDIEVYYKTNK